MIFRLAMKLGAVLSRAAIMVPRLTRVIDDRMTQQTQKLLGLLLLIFLLAWAGYLSFRAYLSPDFLIGFGNLFVC